MQSRTWIAALVFGCGLIPSAPSLAVTQDSFLLRNTADFVDVCSATRSEPLYTAAANFCQGFAVGVFEVLKEEFAAEASPGRLFCVTERMPTRDEAIAEFVAWAKGNPAKVPQSPTNAIAAFLSERFPCPQAPDAEGAKK